MGDRLPSREAIITDVTTSVSRADTDRLASLIEACHDPDAPPLTKPMEYATDLAALQSAYEEADRIALELEDRLKKRKVQIEQYMLDGDLSESFKAGGRTIFRQRQVWAGPALDDAGNADHTALTETLRDLGLTEYLPRSVNTQSFSAYVREHLDPDTSMTLEERLLSDEPKALPRELFAAIKVTEKVSIKANRSR